MSGGNKKKCKKSRWRGFLTRWRGFLIRDFFIENKTFVIFIQPIRILTKRQHTYQFIPTHAIVNYTDHLGNVRLSYAKDPQTGNLKILDESHYYPFGLKHQEYVNFGFVNNPIQGVIITPIINNPYKYKYNGFEYQDELGLGWYDYQARNYDPALGRWMNIDPLAEMSRKTSPYVYALNNPVFFIDPDGMMAESFGQDDVIITGTQSDEAFNQLQSSVEGQLHLTMHESGLISYERTDMNGPLTEAAQGLMDAIDDHSVISTITAENINETPEGNIFVGGAQM